MRLGNGTGLTFSFDGGSIGSLGGGTVGRTDILIRRMKDKVLHVHEIGCRFLLGFSLGVGAFDC